VRILFLGTPAFAVPSLVILADAGHEIVGVVTQPDRPRGRGQRVVPPAVKQAAAARGLGVLQPATLRDPELMSLLRSLAPDLGVVAAYGRLLPQELLDLPRLGLINVHASLLPRWRGAAPIHRAVLAGDTVTGVTIMRVVLALDAGPMLAQVSTAIAADDTSEDLESRLSTLGAHLLDDVVRQLAAGPIGGVRETPQDESLVTYARRLSRQESHIDWARPASRVHRQIHGLQPWPLATAILNDRRVMLLRSAVAHERDLPEDPGTVVVVTPEAITVATRPGAVQILHLQEAGRAAMPVRAYLNGRPVAVGDRLLPVPAPAP
jgi:methionyl-tRNA formyltransferase